MDRATKISILITLENSWDDVVLGRRLRLGTVRLSRPATVITRRRQRLPHSTVFSLGRRTAIYPVGHVPVHVSGLHYAPPPLLRRSAVWPPRYAADRNTFLLFLSFITERSPSTYAQVTHTHEYIYIYILARKNVQSKAEKWRQA